MKKLILLCTALMIGTSAKAQIDYATEIAPIMSNNCNSCHISGSNGFDSSPYADLIASTSSSARYNSKHVIPGNADQSPLVDKIEANPRFGSRMPQGGQLTASEINKIRQWINEGANEQVQTSNEYIADSPNEFKILGNYPNPFNPSTTIQFQLPAVTEFKITIYNANGQLIRAILGSGNAGLKEQSIDLSNQSSGVYIYRIRAFTNGQSNLVGSGRMTLVK